MVNYCQQKVAIGEELSPNQLQGLNLVSHLSRGRDVVFAIDLTQSVNLDDEGRVRLKQIITDSINKGDRVYIVPFSSQVNPSNPQTNPISEAEAIIFLNSREDVDHIINKIPLKTNVQEKNTDIQLVEHIIYENLAQINQNRLCQNLPIQKQSVVWLTDAPLNTLAGISSETWIETPANSPYRDPNTPESQNRQNWLNHLNISKNTRQLQGENYDLTVVDLPATVQEFCTPAPGGKETCFVNSYIFNQLWLPLSLMSLIGLVFIGGIIYYFKHQKALKKVWKLEIKVENDDNLQIHFLRNKGSLSIGEDIECKGRDIRGYLKRKGKNLIIIEANNNDLPIKYKEKEVKGKITINLHKNNSIRLNLPYKNQDYYITIKINK